MPPVKMISLKLPKWMLNSYILVKFAFYKQLGSFQFDYFSGFSEIIPVCMNLVS